MSDQQMSLIPRDLQFWKFRAYGFRKNLRFFDPFFILFLRECGLSFLAIGTLISIREIAANILEIPTGVMAEVVGQLWLEDRGRGRIQERHSSSGAFFASAAATSPSTLRAS